MKIIGGPRLELLNMILKLRMLFKTKQVRLLKAPGEVPSIHSKAMIAWDPILKANLKLDSEIIWRVK